MTTTGGVITVAPPALPHLPGRPTRPAMQARHLLAAAVASAVALALPTVALAAEAADGEISAIPKFTQAFIPALFTLIVFGVLVAVLGKQAWGPISKGLEDRENKIRRDIEEAERARMDAEAKQKEYEQRLATAEGRVRELMAQAQTDAENLQTRIKSDAEADAAERLDRAAREIEGNKDLAVTEVRAEAAALATLVAEKILKREINRDDQDRLVEESLQQVDTMNAQPAGA